MFATNKKQLNEKKWYDMWHWVQVQMNANWIGWSTHRLPCGIDVVQGGIILYTSGT